MTLKKTVSFLAREASRQTADLYLFFLSCKSSSDSHLQVCSRPPGLSLHFSLNQPLDNSEPSLQIPLPQLIYHPMSQLQYTFPGYQVSKQSRQINYRLPLSLHSTMYSLTVLSQHCSRPVNMSLSLSSTSIARALSRSQANIKVSSLQWSPLVPSF